VINLLHFATVLAACWALCEFMMNLLPWVLLESFYLSHSMVTDLSLVSFKSQMRVTFSC